MKVLFLATIPSPYRVNFFNELGKLCELTVFFEKEYSSERSDEWKKFDIVNFKAVFLKGISVKANKAFCSEIIKIYKHTPHDVLVIGGYNTPTSMYLISYLKRHNHPFILSADGGEVKQERKIAYLVKRHFISPATMWIGTSSGTIDYFCHYGAVRDKTRIYPFTSIYDSQVLNTPIEKHEKQELRRKLGMDAGFTIIAVGQFIHRKGFDVLLKAVREINRPLEVYVIGGEPTEEYKSLAGECFLQNIYFQNFMKSADLQKYYMASDLFVLPTREDIWGLVINEAAACGLPIITTKQCVAGEEIIGEYSNGILVEKEDVSALADAIDSLYSDDNLRNEMSMCSLKAAHAYTFEKMAQVHIDIFNEFIRKFKSVQSIEK